MNDTSIDIVGSISAALSSPVFVPEQRPVIEPIVIAFLRNIQRAESRGFTLREKKGRTIDV